MLCQIHIEKRKFFFSTRKNIFRKISSIFKFLLQHGKRAIYRMGKRSCETCLDHAWSEPTGSRRIHQSYRSLGLIVDPRKL